MKLLAGVALMCMGLLAAPSQGQVIYKCVVHGAITYQQDPCPAEAAAKGVSSDTALIGKWSYDRDATVSWMTRHDTLTKAQQAEFEGLGGHLTYVFTKTGGSIQLTDYDVTLASGVAHRKGGKMEFPYTVLSSNPQLVSISAQNPNNLANFTTDFHFEVNGTMWISLANQRLTAVDNPNARFYFKRAH